MTSNNNSKKHWFALKVFYNKVFAIEELLLKKKIKCYIPCETVKVLKQDGTKKNVRKPVINSLLFFHSETYIAKEIQKILTDKVILYTRQIDFKKIPLAIPEREMNIFMLVTSSGEKGLEYFDTDNPKFYQGDHVKVIDGTFNCGKKRATLMELALVSCRCSFSSPSIKADLTRAWQSSNVPSTSMAVIFCPKVVNCFSWISLTFPFG